MWSKREGGEEGGRGLRVDQVEKDMTRSGGGKLM